FNLNRHLRKVHKLNQNQLNRFKLKYSQKGIYNLSVNSSYRQCTYQSCGGKFYKRLDRHLIRKHDHRPHDKNHLQILKRSNNVKPSKCLKYVNSRPLSSKTTETYFPEGNVDLFDKIHDFLNWLVYRV